jgi:hypothetical protein
MRHNLQTCRVKYSLDRIWPGLLPDWSAVLVLFCGISQALVVHFGYFPAAL